MEKRYFPYIIGILFFSLFFLPFLNPLKAQKQQNTNVKRVLILYYDNKGAVSSWIENFDKGLHVSLSDLTEKGLVEMNIEYTDLARNPSTEYIDQLTTLFENKYGSRPPEVIIANMNPSSEFLSKIFNNVFPKAKVVLALNENAYQEILDQYPGRTTSVFIDMQHDSSPKIISRLLPETRNIYVIIGNTDVEQNDLKSVKEGFDRYKDRYDINYLIGMTVDEIVEKVGDLPENSVIYYLTYMGDPSGIPYLSYDVLSRVSENSNAPIFTYFDHYIGKGVVGGALISSEIMGEKTGELAIRILNGEEPSDIPPEKLSTVKIFDWRQLQRWGIDEKLLPEDSIIQYREYSFFEKYRWRIILWINLVILQFALIAYLLVTLSKRKRAEESLSNSEKKYRRLMESSRNAIISVDRDGVINTCNMGATDLFGYREDEMVGKSILILAAEEERERQAANIRGVMETDGFLEYESVMIKRNGNHIPVKINMSTLKNESEEIIGLIKIIMDISEQKIAEEKRINLEMALRQAQKMESIGTLAGGIAHDFNNILTSVLGFTELALFGIEKGTKEEANLHEVLKAGRRAKDLVNQILTFARKTHEEVRPILIGPIVDDVLRLLRSMAPSYIEIVKDMETESLVMADSTRIHQIFLNICTNAIQAMHNSGGILTIEVKDINSNMDHGLKIGEYVKIIISDTGGGIPKENLDLIFDPYFTTKQAGEGTGLGLAVVHGIVESYGGKIFVESELNRGTAFTIYLPATKLHSMNEEYDFEDLPRGFERILFVDDEPSIVDMACQLLESLGYKVTCKNDSKEALELFRERPWDFDLVITDLTMPHMNGDRLGVELMKIRDDIPVILCTGYRNTMSEKTALSLGIKAVLEKPIDYSELAGTIRKVL